MMNQPNIAVEECRLVKRLPPEGVILSDVHVGVLDWHSAQEGIVLDVSFGTSGTDCHLWLAGTGWRTWCETQLGTDDVTTIDTVLLTEIAEWAMGPWLKACGATTAHHHSAPRPCSLIPGQIAVTFSWQVEQNSFQALLLGDVCGHLSDIIIGMLPQMRPVGNPPPLVCPLYIGWNRLSLSDMQRLNIGSGLRVQTFGDPSAGEFVLLMARCIGARITLHGDNKLNINELAQDVARFLDDDHRIISPDDASPVNLDLLPQILLVEVGQAEITLGALREVRAGDILPVEAHFSSSVTLRLNGRAIGQGELVRCGNDFLVRVCRWYPNEAKTELKMPDGVNAW